MTLQSLALRIKEVRDLQKEYMQNQKFELLVQLTDREIELDKLVESIVSEILI